MLVFATNFQLFPPQLFDLKAHKPKHLFYTISRLLLVILKSYGACLQAFVFSLSIRFKVNINNSCLVAQKWDGKKAI